MDYISTLKAQFERYGQNFSSNHKKKIKKNLDKRGIEEFTERKRG